MKEFKKWQEKRALKTIGYLTNLGTYKAGEENGWRAALELVDSMLWLASGQVADEVKERIKKELEER